MSQQAFRDVSDSTGLRNRDISRRVLTFTESEIALQQQLRLLKITNSTAKKRDLIRAISTYQSLSALAGLMEIISNPKQHHTTSIRNSLQEAVYRLCDSVRDDFPTAMHEYPLKDALAWLLYTLWADNVMVDSAGMPSGQYVLQRRHAARLYLRAIKLSLDYNVETIDNSLTDVGAYTVHPSNLAYEMLATRRRQQLKNRKKWVREDRLFDIRKALEDRCITLYTQKPLNLQELKQYAGEILANYPEYVEFLVTSVQERVTAAGS